MKEQQQVPPGIIAFKGIAGNIMTFEESGVSHYNNWVKWRMQEPNTIHTISVDGKEYSVGEKSNKAGDRITSFEYDYEWMANTSIGYRVPVKYLCKFPPPSQQDRSVSQPGKEEPERDFDIDVLLSWISYRNDFDFLTAEMNQYVKDHKFEKAAESRDHRDAKSKILSDLEVTVKELFEKYSFYTCELKSQPSQPGGGWSDTQLKDFGEYCDNHEGSMENLFKQWKSKQTKS